MNGFPLFCRATGCAKVVLHGRLMCPEHWALVPEGLRAAVRETRGERGAVDVLSAACLEARARAVEAVAAAQGRPAWNPYRSALGARHARAAAFAGDGGGGGGAA